MAGVSARSLMTPILLLLFWHPRQRLLERTSFLRQPPRGSAVSYTSTTRLNGESCDGLRSGASRRRPIGLCGVLVAEYRCRSNSSR